MTYDSTVNKYLLYYECEFIPYAGNGKGKNFYRSEKGYRKNLWKFKKHSYNLLVKTISPQ